MPPGVPEVLEDDLTVPSDTEAMRKVQERILEHASALGYPEHDIVAIRQATEEGFVNVRKHGDGSEAQIRFRVAPDATAVYIRNISKKGEVDPNEAPNCTAPENLENPTGRGTLLMRHYMDAIFRKTGEVVEVTMRRPNSASAGRPNDGGGEKKEAPGATTSTDVPSIAMLSPNREGDSHDELRWAA